MSETGAHDSYAAVSSAAYKEMCESILPITMVPRVDGKVFFQEGHSQNPRTAKNPHLAFYRQYVAQSLPVILTGVVDDWPCMHKWASKGNASGGHGKGAGLDGDYVVSAMRGARKEVSTNKEEVKKDGEVELVAEEAEDPEVTISLTPNGWADATTCLEVEKKEGEEGEQQLEEAMLGPAEAKWGLPQLMAHLKRQHASNAHHKLATNYGRSHRKFVPVGQAVSAPARPRREADEGEEEEEEYNDDSDAAGSGDVGGGIEDQRRIKEANEHDVAYPLLEPIVSCDAIAYAQFQNNSLNLQFPQMQQDVGTNVREFGESVFGCDCDAANMWIGGDATITSMHQDWYENLYVVVAGGAKTFHLVPPWEAPLLDKRYLREGTWVLKEGEEKETTAAEDGEGVDETAATAAISAKSNGSSGSEYDGSPGFFVGKKWQAIVNQSEDPDDKVPWVSKDVADPIDFPPTEQRPTILTVDVQPGEVFYMPAMWFHRVSHKTNLREVDTSEEYDAQHLKNKKENNKKMEDAPPAREDLSCVPGVMAVNYWFDMAFDNPLVGIQEFFKQTEGKRRGAGGGDGEGGELSNFLRPKFVEN